jgi:dTDP-4-dehydrorhamnose reductase
VPIRRRRARGPLMRLLITGAGGMLGSSMVPTLVSVGHEVVATDLRAPDSHPWGEHGPMLSLLDVRSQAAVDDAVAVVRPDMVLHMAAETDLEVCERGPDDAFLTNALGTKFVAIACQRAGIPMTYISTAGVFDGVKVGAYTEFDAPNPINVYGHSKLEGEHYVKMFLDRFFIVRAGWMVGGGILDHKFVARILGQLKDGATVIRAVADKLGTPTYAPDFSLTLSNLLKTESWGTYHCACEGSGSRFDVAVEMIRCLGREDVQVLPVASDYLQAEFFAPRPRSEIMRNLCLDLQGLNTMRPWRAAIADYLSEHHASSS